MPKFHEAIKDNTIKMNDTTGYSEEPMIYEALDGDVSPYVAPVTASRVSYSLGPELLYYEVPSQHIAQAVKADDDSEQPQLYLDVISIDNEEEIFQIQLNKLDNYKTKKIRNQMTNYLICMFCILYTVYYTYFNVAYL